MRQIIFSNAFDAAVEAIGGYRLLDVALEAVIDGLRLNPYGFTHVENDFGSFRYAVTAAHGEVPSLVVFFNIMSNKDVELTHVEIHEKY